MSTPNTAHLPPHLRAALRRAWGRTWRAEAKREAHATGPDLRAQLRELGDVLIIAAAHPDDEVVATVAGLAARRGATLARLAGEIR